VTAMLPQLVRIIRTRNIEGLSLAMFVLYFGGELNISEITVKAHRGQVMRKNRPEATITPESERTHTHGSTRKGGQYFRERAGAGHPRGSVAAGGRGPR
jgi:hypothetical protein